jgi:hypothetical protein
MVQQLNDPKDLAAEFDFHTIVIPARYAVDLPRDLLAQSSGQPAFGVLPTGDGGRVVWALR